MKIRLALILLAFSQQLAFGQEVRLWMEISQTEDYPGLYGEKKISYELIRGTFIGEVDPSDPHNSIITDLELADRNENGMTEYRSDFILIKPRNMKHSNGILRYDAPNRGNANARPDSFLMARGYSFLAAAWQGDVARPPAETGPANELRNNPMQAMMRNRLYLDLPLAHHPDGSPITGKIRVEFLARASGTYQMPLIGSGFNSGGIAYAPAGFPDNAGCVLTRRINEGDPRRYIPNSEWAFASTSETDPFPGTPDQGLVSLKGGFDPAYLYELVYVAKDPLVMGLGLAAIRDIVSFFRDASTDSEGNKNPVAGSIRYTLGTGNSQSGNFMKTFVHLGFNESLNGRMVFDGLLPTVGTRQTNINMRFAVPGGGASLRSEFTAYGQSSVRAFDPDYVDEITGAKGGIFTRATETNTVPKFFMFLTSAEIWALQASPLFTDAYGIRDLEQPENLRIYYIAGAQHSIRSSGPGNWTPGRSKYPGSTMVDGGPVLDAIWIALEEWVTLGIEPPESEIPSVGEGTLVFPEDLVYPQMKGVTWTSNGEEYAIPEFEYMGLINPLRLLYYGPDYRNADESGIATIVPPAYLGKDYAIMVPQVDEDGNEVAGVRTPEMAAPLGTSLGYGYNGSATDLTGFNGSFIPFHKTRAERLAAGDSRLSLEERYGSRENYILAVTDAANRLLEKRLLLKAGVDEIIERARNTDLY